MIESPSKEGPFIDAKTYYKMEEIMEKKDVLDAASDRMNKRVRRRVSQELVSEARKRGARGPEPGAGGRPPSEAPKTFRASVRFSEGEESLIKEAALETGETVAEFIRSAAIGKAEKQS